jgi:hypothetical protein
MGVSQLLLALWLLAKALRGAPDLPVADRLTTARECQGAAVALRGPRRAECERGELVGLAAALQRMRGRQVAFPHVRTDERTPFRYDAEQTSDVCSHSNSHTWCRPAAYIDASTGFI